MVEEPREAAEVARALADAFAAAGIDYVIGGALSYGIWAVPRGTVDVDITVFVELSDANRVVAVLRPFGAGIPATEAEEGWRSRGMFRTTAFGLRVEVFFPDIDLYADARARRKQVEFLGAPAWFWSAEDILLFKMLYFRAKDQADIERLVAIQRGRLDLSYVFGWLTRIFDEQDERLRWLRGIIDGPGSA